MSLEAIIQRIHEEPVLVRSLIGAIAVLLVAFGIPVSDEISAALIAVILALVAILSRGKVEPIAKQERLQSEQDIRDLVGGDDWGR